MDLPSCAKALTEILPYSKLSNTTRHLLCNMLLKIIIITIIIKESTFTWCYLVPGTKISPKDAFPI